MAEALAVRWTLKTTVDLKITKAVIHSNALSIVDCINRLSYSVELELIIVDCLSLLSLFSLTTCVISLKVSFLTLFVAIQNATGSILSSGYWVDGKWCWKLVSETDLLPALASEELSNLLTILAELHPLPNELDSFIWWRDSAGFSVKSVYKWLSGSSLSGTMQNSANSSIFKKLWKVAVPSNIKFFGWRLLLDRLPTCIQLGKRGVILPNDCSCPFCSNVEESAIHLFFHCSVSVQLWTKTFVWLRIPLYNLQGSVLENFGSFVYPIGNLNDKFWRILWLAATWILWKVRNDLIFNNIAFDLNVLFCRLKATLWDWLGFCNRVSMEFSWEDWLINPAECL
ncbi:uncharacterized protein LOC131623907 [Vicia villosa]|uniref:uncharacterized protein LOC131623907 n=1 Tax=Vicia villosa TaxID=3911 RepID=UPI00273C5612|nr:uncharacterized protein LOC131623907 [Vicia villosa]